MRFATIRFLCLTAIALGHTCAQVTGTPKQSGTPFEAPGLPHG